MAINVAKMVVEITTDISKMTKGMKDADDNLAKFSRRATITGVGLTAAITVPAIAAAKGMLNVAMGMEQSEIAFTTLLGSAQKATGFLKDLKDFAAGTPFEFTELQDASRKLIALGFSAKEVLPMMRNIGDATSALGAGSDGVARIVKALGDMNSAAKLNLQDIKQLTELGIPAYKILAEAYGTTTSDILEKISKGLISSGDAVKIFLEGFETTYGNAMADQMQTTAGQLSNLKDEITFLAADLGEQLLPVVKDVVEAAKNAVSAFSGLSPETQKTILVIGGLAAVSGPALTALGGLASAARAFITVLPGLKAAFSLMAGAKTIGGALSVAQLGMTGLTAVAIPAAAAIAGVAIAFNMLSTEATNAAAKNAMNAWEEFFEKQSTSGRDAGEILKYYRLEQTKLQNQMQAKWTKTDQGWGLEWDDFKKLFIKNKDELAQDAERLNEMLIATSETYEGYMRIIHYGQLGLSAVNEAQWNAVNGITAFEEAVVSAADESAGAFQRMVDAAGKTKGELSGLLTDYQNISQEMDNWVANTASGVVNMLGTKLPEASQAYKDALAGVDEVMGSDYLAQYELKESIKGLVDEYARTKDLDAFKSGLVAIKDEGLADMETKLQDVVTKAQELYDKLTQIPEAIKIAIEFDYELPPWFPQTGGTKKGTTSTEGLKYKDEALGGSVYPGLPYLVGERGMEMFVPQTAGKIVPANQIGTRSVVFETGSIQVTAPNKNTDIPFLVDTLVDEIQRRLI
jgi:tape measure domain-containing protein